MCSKTPPEQRNHRHSATRGIERNAPYDDPPPRRRSRSPTGCGRPETLTAGCRSGRPTWSATRTHCIWAHKRDARQLPMGASSSTVAVATRRTREREISGSVLSAPHLVPSWCLCTAIGPGAAWRFCWSSVPSVSQASIGTPASTRRRSGSAHCGQTCSRPERAVDHAGRCLPFVGAKRAPPPSSSPRRAGPSRSSWVVRYRV